ncbi:Glycyl-tRNA synthetase beta chain [Labilithrix luteola]|uniref:Glycine--tRNA ligase beta subunit n=1 Tax=Labilithrix luteola TaxID=1391654 RepID=A0A0K1Q0I5_9BACT|nr:glycine--tRNA ligase subunit beta [Labilithrix luteola]AKU99288.1 Glycyl-tRNA synthetase beta chain [Labilithrix luteola]
MGKTLLLEIGTEELPSSFVDTALAAMPALARAKLEALRLPHGDVRAVGTPRRLTLIVSDVAERQPDLDEEVIGPPETAAFKDGKPTKAAEAFANKLGLSLDAIQVVDKPAAGKTKAGRYVVGRRKEQGRDAREIVGKALTELCTEIPFRKSMRWGAGDATFGRPVQWLVALFGDQVIDTSFAGVRSGRTSKGHRFLSTGAVEIPSADAYVAKMRDSHVIVDRNEREKTMMDRIVAAAKAAGGTYDPSPDLVSENASLVEEPFVVTGAYDPAFLALPAAVIRSVARGHQKYFCVQTSETELLPSYLAVVNTANDPARISKGMDRVMRSRLSDAQFFFGEDKKAKLEDRVEKLAGIVFHNRLGTVREKVTRIEKLSGRIAEALGLPEKTRGFVARAAHLCKFDLVSLMVGEFPELQGDMGRVYAETAGEAPEVANAIRDHYRPIGAEGPVAQDDVSACVALADRLDTLAGCFAVGLSPTGAADPFALRRACIATLRTLLDRGATNPAYAKLPLSELFGWAYDGIEGKKLDLSREETVAKLRDFTHDRLRGLIANATSNSVADAVSGASAVEYPVHTLARARAVYAAVTEGRAWLEKARIVAKRLSGISKESKPVLHDKSVFEKADDAIIVEVVGKVDASTRELHTEAAVTAALAQAEDLAQRLDDVFTRTLVNDPNDARTPRRLELLSYGAQCMLRIGDFSKLG